MVPERAHVFGKTWLRGFYRLKIEAIWSVSLSSGQVAFAMALCDTRQSGKSCQFSGKYEKSWKSFHEFRFALISQSGDVTSLKLDQRTWRKPWHDMTWQHHPTACTASGHLIYVRIQAYCCWGKTSSFLKTTLKPLARVLWWGWNPVWSPSPCWTLQWSAPLHKEPTWLCWRTPAAADIEVTLEYQWCS